MPPTPKPRARLFPGLLPGLLLGIAAAPALAAPAFRPLPPGPHPQYLMEWDVDDDGMVDLKARSETMITNSIPGASYQNVMLTPRAGMELQTTGTPHAALAGLAPGAVVGPASPWWQGGNAGGISLGGENSTPSGTQLHGPLANTAAGWIGFRLQRGGRTYYGALQGGRSTFRNGFGTLVELPPHSFHAVLLETEPDTPLTLRPPFMSIAAAGAQVLEGLNVDFGQVGVGQHHRQAFTVTNITGEALENLVWGFTGPHAADFTFAQPLPARLEAGQAAVIHVGFSPATAGARQAVLRLARGAQDATPFVLTLSGAGSLAPAALVLEEPGLEGSVTPVDLGVPFDMGVVPVGEVALRRLRVRNTGVKVFEGYAEIFHPLRISALGLFFPWPETQTIQPPAAGFSVLNAQRFSLAPGESMVVEIAWHPTNLEPGLENLVIRSLNEGPTLHLTLSGRAAREGPVRSYVLFRLGDGQDPAVTSGGPVGNEPGAVMGDPLRWLGQNLIRGGLNGELTFGYPGDYMPVLSSVDPRRPALLPLADAGMGAPTGSRAALRFAAGQELADEAFGVPQYEGLGMQVWVRAESVTGTHAVVQFADAEGDGLGLWQVEGVWRGRVSQGQWVGGEAVRPGVWQHLALVRHQGLTSLYVDGEPAGVPSSAPIRLPAFGSTQRPRPAGLRLGGAQTPNGTAFAGDLDELQFFALDPTAAFDPKLHLSLGASPLVKLIAAATELAAMQGQSRTTYVELMNAGDGYARITRKAVTGPGAADYGVTDTSPATWADGPPGSTRGVDRPFVLAPGERRLFEVNFAPSAIGPRPALLTFETNDAAHRVLECALYGMGLEQAPQLSIGGLSSQSPELNFGRVTTGTVRRKLITLLNTAAQTLHNLTWSIAGDEPPSFQVASWSHGWPYPLLSPAGTLHPGQWVALYVEYSPQTEAAHEAVLRIECGNPSFEPREILLTGRGMPHLPKMDVRQNGGIPVPGQVVEFGQVMIGTHPAFMQQFQVLNSGSLPLVMHDIGLGGLHEGDFDLQPADSAPTLLPGEAVFLTVVFRPSAPGLRSAQLRFAGNDPDMPVWEFPLTGVGIPAAGEISLYQGGRALPPNQAFVNLGEALPGGLGDEAEIHVVNQGSQPLSGLGVTVMGQDAASFEVSAPGASVLEPGGNTSFKVRLRPGRLGPVGATVHVSSSDPDEPVTAVHVGGTGSFAAHSVLRAGQLGWVGGAIAEGLGGSLFLAGYSVAPGNQKATYAVRLVRADGRETEGAKPNGLVRAMAPLANGGVVMVGDFTQVAGVPRQGVARLMADGSLDLGFVPPEGTFTGSAVVALAGGKVLAGGAGTLGGRAHLVRLEPNGALDSSWSLPEPGGRVTHLALQDDGAVLVAGEFMNYLTTLDVGAVWLRIQPAGSLVRLKPDGSLDAGFGMSGPIVSLATGGDRIWTVKRQPNYSTKTPSLPPASQELVSWSDELLGLDLAGQVISTRELGRHDVHTDAVSRVLAVQMDGAVLVAPGPSFWGTGGNLQQMSRYRADGAVDETFYAIFGMPAEVKSVLVRADGKVAVAGKFDGVNQWMGAFIWPSPSFEPTTGQPGHGDGGPVSGFVQLQPDGDYRPDLRLSFSGGGAVLSDGLSTLRLHSENGGEAEVFVEAESYLNLLNAVPAVPVSSLVGIIDGPAAEDFRVEVVETPPSSHYYWPKVRLAVRFRPGGPGLREATLRLTPGAHPGLNPCEIRLSGTSGPLLPLTVADMTSGALLEQGQVVRHDGLAPGATTALSYLLKHGGPPNGPVAKNLRLRLSGPQAAWFSVTSQPPAMMAGGAAIPLEIRVTPLAAGVGQAVVELLSQEQALFSWTLQAAAEPLAEIAHTNQDQILRVGESAVLVAPPDEAATAWQWFKNGALIRGAQQSTLQLPAMNMTHAGLYSVRKTVAGRPITLSVGRLAVITDAPKALHYLPGKPLSLAFQAAGEGLSCQWFKDDQPLVDGKERAGSRARTLWLRAPGADAAGRYGCEVTMGATRRKVAAHWLQVMQAPELALVEGTYRWTLGCEVMDRLVAGGGASQFRVEGLPPGVRFHPLTGQFSGRPQRTGSYAMKARVTNAAGTSAISVLPAQVEPLTHAGSYSGLVNRAPGVFGGRGGRVVFTVSSLGAVTGSLSTVLDPARQVKLAFVGALMPGDAGLKVRASVIAGAGRAPVVLEFPLGAEGAFEILVDGIAAGRGGRRSTRSLVAGVGTLALEAPPEAAALRAAGYARYHLSAAGVISLTGKQGGFSGVRPLVASAEAVALSATETGFPIHAILAGAETLSGWLIYNTATREVDGNGVGWNAPVVGGVWAGGDVSLLARGGPWSVAASPGLEVDLDAKGPNARFVFAAGAQKVRLTRQQRIEPEGGLPWPAPAADGLVKLVLQAPSGTFSGSTWAPLEGTAESVPAGRFEGMFIPRLNRGVGLLIHSPAPSPTSRQAQAMSLEPWTE